MNVVTTKSQEERKCESFQVHMCRMVPTKSVARKRKEKSHVGGEENIKCKRGK